MSRIRLQDICLKFGKHELFKTINFSAQIQERICIIGHNGAGKSTLVKLLCSKIQPDSGDIHYSDDLRLGRLDQSLIKTTSMSVFNFLKEGLVAQQQAIEQFSQLSQKLSENPNDKDILKQLQHTQSTIEAGGGWDIDQQVEQIGNRLKLPLHKTLNELSGGWMRRVAIGQVFVQNPNFLILDEPTNHLDIHSIDWLETLLKNFNGTVLFITHDRTFLQNLATRIIEIDRGKLLNFPGDYKHYLIKKAELNHIEDKEHSLFNKRLATEEIWIRQGVKARRTRNEGRVRNLEQMRKESEKIVKRAGRIKIHIASAQPSGQKVIEAYNLTHRFANQTIVENFNIKIQRGQKIGIVGNNGVGKTTLLHLLLGKIIPQTSSVKLGKNLQIGYSNQMSHGLIEHKSIAHNVADDGEYIEINGKPRHVVGYMKNFLFTPETILKKVAVLSGGEKNRVALAKLLVKPTNLLVLDEPTNDLDIELIDVLAEQLRAYQGTLLIVSHDRDFLDQCVEKIIVFEQAGVKEYVGGYADWQKRGKHLAVVDTLVEKSKPTPNSQLTQNPPNQNPKNIKKPVIKQKSQQQIQSILSAIEDTEKQIAKLTQHIKSTAFNNLNYPEQQPFLEQLKNAQTQFEQLSDQWQALER